MANTGKISIILFLVFSLISSIVFSKPGHDKVILQLKWKHQFQFAGYYAALEKGFYSGVGLDVEIREISENSPIIEVIEGKAHFGIGSGELIASYMNGKPIVLLASIFQHSPSVIIVKENSDIYNPHDLVGKILMAEPDDRGYEILSMIYNEGVKPDQFELITHSYSINDLLVGNVDALGGYISNETFFLESHGIPFRVINPRNYGIDFYSDCIFTSQKEIFKNPERVKRFLEASIKGWEYALTHKEEISTLIISKYNPAKTYQQLIFEANSIHGLINSDLVEIGHTNRGRWQRMAEILYQLELVEKLRNIDGFFYSPDYGHGTNWYKISLIISILFLLTFLVGYVLYKHFYIAVRRRTEKVQELVSKLESQNKEISTINSELMKAKQTLEDDFNDKSFFFSGLIGELKNPITNLVNLAEQISSTSITQEQRQRLSLGIKQSSNLLLNFIKNIINISSLDSSENLLSYKAVVLDTLFENYYEDYRTNFLHKEVDLKTNFPSKKDTSKYLIDDDRLLRIVDALIRNAFKHTKEGYVEMGYVMAESELLQFWVKDTGKGFNNEVVKLVNQYFENPTQIFSKKIGFGLSIIKSLVLKMRGNLKVESIEKSGSCFFVNIPIIPIENLRVKNETLKKFEELLPKNLIQRIYGKTVLISDKHPNNYVLIKTLVNGTGCNLIYSESHNKTIDICLGYPKIDMVIMGMSVISNYEMDTAKTIQNSRPLLPIIAYVTFGFEHKEKYIESGFCDVIQRPLPQVQLVAKIIEHI